MNIKSTVVCFWNIHIEMFRYTCITQRELVEHSLKNFWDMIPPKIMNETIVLYFGIFGLHKQVKIPILYLNSSEIFKPVNTSFCYNHIL